MVFGIGALHIQHEGIGELLRFRQPKTSTVIVNISSVCNRMTHPTFCGTLPARGVHDGKRSLEDSIQKRAYIRVGTLIISAAVLLANDILFPVL